MGELSGQVIWVTGASSGIGEALSVELSGRGARLVLSARRREELERVAGRCQGEPLVLPLDLAEPETFDPLVQTVLDQLGQVDVLVHNGGISQRALAEHTSVEVDRRLMEVNYFGAVALTKRVLPSMLARGSGHFVVVSSVMGKIGTPLRSAYAASKHALHGFFDCLRAEVSDRGLVVSIICPGFIQTEISKHALSGDGQPHGVMDGDIAGGLASEEAARQIARAMERGDSEAFVGSWGKEWAALQLKRFVPSLLEWMVRAKATS